MHRHYVLRVIVLQGNHNLIDVFIPSRGSISSVSSISIRGHDDGSGKEKVGGKDATISTLSKALAQQS